MHAYYVYILTNVKRNVMYVGVTNNLETRLADHVDGRGGSFTRKYRLNTLVHVEEFQFVDEAITREKQIKGWRRDKKGRSGDGIQSDMGGPCRSGRSERSLATLGMTVLPSSTFVRPSVDGYGAAFGLNFCTRFPLSTSPV